MKRPLVINVLLEDTAMFGGVKVPIHQANLLAARGHRVTIVTRGDRPDWYRIAAGFARVASFEPAGLPAADVTVATFWTTIRAAAAAPSGRALHYCQGFEASYLHNVEEHPAILEAYRTPIPCMAVSPHLATLVHERFGRPVTVVPPCLEGFWRPAWRRRPGSPPRIAVVGPFENLWKGVATALEAVRAIRQRGVRCSLVRISPLPLTAEETALVTPDEVHVRVPPPAVAGILRRADVVLAPSWEQEGFGLPVLEAMACGVPVVASDISSFRALASEAAVLVPCDLPQRFADGALGVLEDASRWRALRRRGLAVARRYSEARIAPRVEDAMYWALADQPEMGG